MKSVVAALLCLLGFLSSAAALVVLHAVPTKTTTAGRHVSNTRVSTTDVSRFVATVAAAAVFAFHPMGVAAMANDVIPSSTIQVADAIKELDFSLPNYDEVKSYKASVETVKSLSIKPATTKASDISKRTSAPKSSDSDVEPKGAFSVSTFLPSVGKQGPKTATSAQGYDF